MRIYLLFILFSVFFYFSDIPAYPAAQKHNIGFRTMGVWNLDSKMRFDFNIWYPTLRSGQTVNISYWILENVAINARPMEGRFPLLIISHASPGNRFSYEYLASFFTSHGYIVVAPGHSTDSMENMEDLFTWNQLDKRVQEIKSTLDLLLNDKLFSKIIDPARIAFIGFGSGATTGLLLCGAKPNCEQWPTYCAKAGKDDVYCSLWARDRIEILCKNFPLQFDLRDRRIKSFALIAPAYGMMFTKASFSEVNVPILLVGSGKDSFNKVELHCEPLARILGKKANYLDLPSSDAGSLMSSCSRALQQELPELCLSVDKEERNFQHKRLEQALWTFFSDYNSASR